MWINKVTAALLLLALMSGTSFARSRALRQELDLSSLSGLWQGTMQVRQVGRCSIEGEREARFDVWIRLRVTADGALTANVSMKGPNDEGRRVLTGSVDERGKVRLEDEAEATCSGRPRAYLIKFSGKVGDKDGRAWLEFEGTDRACPNLDCVFRQTFELTRPPAARPN